jgi:O-antigen/teichoic acid export membrane protein
VYGICFSLTTFIGTVFEAVGRPDYSLKYCLISLAGVVIAIFSGKNYGLVGVAFALAVYAVLMNIIGHIMVKRVILLGLRSYAKALVPAAISSMMMAAGIAALIWVQANIINLPNLWFVLQSIVAGMVFYAYSLFIFNKQTYREMIELAHKLTRRGE